MWHLFGVFALTVGLGLESEEGTVNGKRQEGGMTDTRGVIYLIDGVGGWGLAPKVMEKTLADAGVPHEIRQFYWSHGFGRWHADLTDDENLRRKGSELADVVMGFHVRHREQPIYLVAKSGGTAVALRALAELPEGSVERVVLLSAAVSPTYDLVPALRAVRADLVSFWSPKDKLVLGFGTSFFGTADGVLGHGAGLVGFRVPEHADEAVLVEYRKLRQVEWDPSMRKTYNFGTHLGTSMPLFVRQYVAPLLGGRGELEETAEEESGTNDE